MVHMKPVVRALSLTLLAALAAPATATTIVSLVPSGGANPRWSDIADNPYGPAFQTTFSYASASVLLSYEEEATTFVGALIADGLKPNFAYQIKFRAGHDSPGMEPLGYMGRWWFGGSPLNVSDAYYEDHKDDPNVSSYMLFDYFVTDPLGHAIVPLALDSTYHVLWRHHITGVPGVALPGPNDGPSIDTLVDPEIGFAYDADYAEQLVGVFGEYEHTADNVRPLPGTLVMPQGYYSLELVLTEESFHSSDGWWAEAMVSPSGEPIAFTVSGQAVIPEPASLALALFGLAGLAIRRKRGR